MGASDRLNEPYLIGGPLTGPDGVMLPVAIDGRSFLVDTSRQTNQSERFRRSSVQLLNSQQNIDKGESALTTPEVWRRTYKSWHHGMGQSFADREDADQFRYDWSKGIDVWTRWQVGLLHDTTQVNATPTMTGLVVNGVVVSQSTNRRLLFLTDGTNTTTHTLAADSTLVTDGYYLYAYQATTNVLLAFTITVSGATITITQTSSTPMHFDTAGDPLTMLVFANMKLVAATTKGKVYDCTAYLGGTKPTALPTAAYTPPVPTLRFVSGCSGRKAIYLLSVVGDRSAVHGFDIARSSSDGAIDTLVYSGVVAELPDGEIGKCIYSYLGYVAIGSNRGFRFAAVGEGGIGLTYGPLIETPDAVTAFEGQDRFLYYALKNYRGDSGIGRADLSQFVADLQPAYASDLMTSNTPPNGDVTFIATLNSGKVIFGLSDAGVWQEQDTYVAAGEITLSGWTFNVVDMKTGLYVTSQTTSKSGGTGSLSVFYDKSTNEVLLGDYQQPNQKFSMSGVPFYSAALHADLAPSPDRLNTPHVYSVEMRSTYVRGKASEWQVPCILHDEIEQDNGAVQGRDVIADYTHLMSLVESGRQFTYIEDGQKWTVYATDFVWSPQERSQTAGWQGVFTIYFREVR